MPDLSFSQLFGLDLRGVDFGSTNLRRALLQRTNLSGVSFFMAELDEFAGRGEAAGEEALASLEGLLWRSLVLWIVEFLREDRERGFRLDPRDLAACAHLGRLLVLVNPSNPTGAVVAPDLDGLG